MYRYGSAKYNQSDSQPGTNRRVFSLKVLLLASLASLSNPIALNAQQGAPELFSYDELTQLYEPAIPTDALQNKLHLLLTTPFVSNAASARGVKPLLPSTAKLGKFVRVVEWNIERGLEYDALQEF